MLKLIEYDNKLHVNVPLASIIKLRKKYTNTLFSVKLLDELIPYYQTNIVGNTHKYKYGLKYSNDIRKFYVDVFVKLFRLSSVTH